MRTLCVSIHDVTPTTWHQCQMLASAVAEVDERIPLTLLVVPDYHNQGDAVPAPYKTWLQRRLGRGDEIALHGYKHCDTAARARSLHDRLRREVYTAREGEFATLTRDEAAQRIAAGRAWCSAHGWPVRGFVAPAWLMSPGTWEALAQFDFSYTTTLTQFHILVARKSLRAPAAVYSARAAWRRSLSRWWNEALVRSAETMPLLRFGLHPADAQYPALIAHAQALLDRARRGRVALTKSDFAILARCTPNSVTSER